ncbi:hypothetical protein Pan216_09930 [Planctomycetes bacterium Pan216]|uniref:BioF2-like acetyltransferase domain-containing protein n=1 Tax=Kolteria novifilia TaxID=2527975 RepID=A0A518AZL2_9BACT|nr:hypothetical protein Pan216_09930 [Planctomycetes bacterium Pan216]
MNTAVVSSIADISDDDLDEITADGHVFASTSWYRMLERLDLRTIVGGDVELYFVVVRADDRPVAVCPLLRARGEGVYFVYSLRRYYFEHWIEEAVRIDPSQSRHFARLMAGVSVYRKSLQLSGAPLDDCLIVTNPLSYRGTVPVAPSSSSFRLEVYGALLDGLKRFSRRRNLPLWFLSVDESDSRWPKMLEGAGCQRTFLFYDNQLNLDPYESFDDYLGSFRRTTRRAFQRDIVRTSRAGFTFRTIEDFGTISGQLSELYRQTYKRYGESFFRHPPSFWRTLNDTLGESVDVIACEYEGAMVGFTVLLHSQRRGEMWTYRIGRSYDENIAQAPFYFSLSFYAPIQHAIDKGCRRIWLGPASYEAKSVRGADQVPLYSYFWFPRRWDRWLLAPYLQLFGDVSKDQIHRSMARPVRVGEQVGLDRKKNRERGKRG